MSAQNPTPDDLLTGELLIELMKELRLDLSGADTSEILLAVKRLRAENARLLKVMKQAREELRSTTLNWQEQCLFNCDDILSSALAETKCKECGGSFLHKEGCSKENDFWEE